MKGSIPEDKIKEIKEKASIVEVVSDFVALRKAGRNHLGLCPFHSEKTPSFTVNEEKGIFHCFGCGAGGSVFNFLMLASQLSFPEAVRELAKRVGVVLPERELSEEEKRHRNLRGRLFEINELTATYYQQVLRAQKEGAEGRRYLEKRGLAEKTLEEHTLGFASAAWDSLVFFLQKKGVPLNLAANLGLILPRKEGTAGGGQPSFYDRFRRRIIFPIRNEAGRVCGFGGRRVEEETGNGGSESPKYMNSPESVIYSKGQMLYGLHLAKGPIREKGNALIVEGYMDLLSLHQEGIRNVVASLGTALTSAQVGLLGRYTKEAVLVFDADEGGEKATQRSLDLFLKEGLSARVISLPAGFDPDQFIRQEKKEGFERILSGGLPLMEYLLEQAMRRHATNTVEGKVRVVRELLPTLSRLKDPLEQNLYVERLAHRLELKESQIRSQLPGQNSPGASPEKTVPSRPRGPAHERLLLQLMLLHSQVIPAVKETVGREGFSDPRHQKLAQELLDLWEGEQRIDPSKILDRMADEDLKNLVAELLLTEESVTEVERILKDCLLRTKLVRMRRQIQEVDEEIRQRSRTGKEAPAEIPGLRELLKRKQRLLMEQKRWIDDSPRGPIPQAG
jgi:DNA primase